MKRKQNMEIYQDQKRKCNSILDDHFIKILFLKRGKELIYSKMYNGSDDPDDPEFIMYKYMLKMIANSFNKLNYLDNDTAQYITDIFDAEYDNWSEIPNEDIYCRTVSEGKNEYYILSLRDESHEPNFLTYLTWFTLNFEHKFLFREIDSKFLNLKWI
ncbi:hypothetical protein RF11_07461 [Thelohanellus kitauei]|uniref:Uncharacterized protein n=1 Tax=Thelohanellus kitauei TaxID=669202 RepID=A0A0C2IPR1_THEKT|nr:hypothetical protein RF11_07461 [Thelohanellus kitauei]